VAVLCSLGSGQSGVRSGSTVAADRQAGAFAGVAVSVVDEETGRAGELVGLSRHDPHREFLPGQVRPGQLEAFRGVGLLDIDRRGLRLAVSLFQYLQGVFDHRVGLVESWRVVVSCHRCIPALPHRAVTGVRPTMLENAVVGHVLFLENRGRAPSSSLRSDLGRDTCADRYEERPEDDQKLWRCG